MTSEPAQRRTPKVPRDHDDDEEIRLNQIGGRQDDDDDEDDHKQIAKAKRHDIEVPISEVDMKLVRKLDSILNISDTRKPRFFTNKPKGEEQKCYSEPAPEKPSNLSDNKILLKHRNLTKDQLKQRLLEKYETLVPELDPKRPTVNVVQILSATESLELARGEAKKQMENQLGLSSIRSNQLTSKRGTSSFRFRDNDDSTLIEEPISRDKPNGRKGKSVSFAPNEENNGVMATVKFFKPDENEASSSGGWWSFHSRFTAQDDGDHDDDDEDEDEEEEDEDDDDDDDSDDDVDHSEDEDDSEENTGGIGIYMSKPDATRKPK